MPKPGQRLTNIDVLYETDFASGDQASTTGAIIEEILEDHDLSDVLILKRFPTGIRTFAERLSQDLPGVVRPNVVSVNRHARDVVRNGDPTLSLLGQADRLTVVKDFIDSVSWDSEYLQNAATKPSFHRDVGRLMTILTWQGGPPVQPDNEELAEIVEVTDRFHDWLGDHGVAERAQIVSKATAQLANNDLQEQVQQSFDIVLAIEFEEFAPIDRQYLSALSQGKELVCVAEADSSIQRVWNEPGTIREHVNAREVRTRTDTAKRGRPTAIAHYLARKTVSVPPTDGHVGIISEETFEDQVRSVTDEITRLRREHGWTYDEFAVLLKNSQGPLNDTIRLIQQAGVPTASVSISGFSDDPAIREIHGLAKFMMSGSEADYSRLRSMVSDHPVPEPDDLANVDSIVDGLWKWIETTQLKDRIATAESPLESRAQFGHVKEVLSFARFVEESPLMEASWRTFLDGLMEMFEYASPDVVTSDIDVKENGVLVDAVRVAKNASWKAVFILDVVEQNYPSSPALTALFPDRQLSKMEGYPGVTTPTAADVRGTFRTAPDSIDDPYDRYYAELSRRLLAVGARAAEERLYFGLSKQEESATSKHRQPSRFLVEVVDQFPWVEEHTGEEVIGQASAERFALSRVERAMQRINRAHLANEPIELEEVEADLAAIQGLLEAGGARAKTLRGAIEARVDLTAGRIRHE